MSRAWPRRSIGCGANGPSDPAANLSATSSEWKDVAGAKSIEADVVIFPSRYLGELCTRGWLQPVRPSVLEGDEFNGDDVFPLVRRELMRWGGEVMALPLGVELAVPGKLKQVASGA